MPKERLSRCIKLFLLLSLPVVCYLIPVDGIYNGESICLFTNIFGVECWGCGITRAIFSALHFRFAEAWEYNRLVVIVLPLLLLVWTRAVLKLIRRK